MDRKGTKWKITPINFGLYVCVPGVDKKKIHAFCEPFVPKEKMNIDIVTRCLGKTKSPAEWGGKFALLNDGEKTEEENHAKKKALISKFRAVATPGPSKRKRKAEKEEREKWLGKYPVTNEEKSYVEAEGSDFVPLLVHMVLNLKRAFVEMQVQVPQALERTSMRLDGVEEQVDAASMLVRQIEGVMGKPSGAFRNTTLVSLV